MYNKFARLVDVYLDQVKSYRIMREFSQVIFPAAYLLCLILSISASCLRICCSSSDSLWTGISTMPIL